MNLGDKAGSVEYNIYHLRQLDLFFWEILVGIIQNPDKMNNFGLMH